MEKEAGPPESGLAGRVLLDREEVRPTGQVRAGGRRPGIEAQALGVEALEVEGHGRSVTDRDAGHRQAVVGGQQLDLIQLGREGLAPADRTLDRLHEGRTGFWASATLTMAGGGQPTDGSFMGMRSPGVRLGGVVGRIAYCWIHFHYMAALRRMRRFPTPGRMWIHTWTNAWRESCTDLGARTWRSCRSRLRVPAVWAEVVALVVPSGLKVTV